MPKSAQLVANETRDFRTENRARYADPGLARTQPFKPPVTLIQSGPFDAVPTYKADFTGQVSPPAELYRPPVSQPNGRDARDFATENSENFGNKGFQARPSMKPAEAARESAPFEAVSSYRADFQQHNARPAASYVPSARNMVTQEDRDFRPESSRYGVAGYHARDSLKPAERVVTTAPFDATTSYKSDFVHHKIPFYNPEQTLQATARGEAAPASNLAQTRVSARTVKQQLATSSLIPQATEPLAVSRRGGVAVARN